MAENNSAQRTRKIPDRKDGKREDQRNKVIRRGKKGRRDVLREYAVDDEIVKLKGTPEACQRDDSPLGPRECRVASSAGPVYFGATHEKLAASFGSPVPL